ncbi:MAG: polysaccharide biosynthesis/export family protein [Planctomycetota bacterium]
MLRLLLATFVCIQLCFLSAAVPAVAQQYHYVRRPVVRNNPSYAYRSVYQSPSMRASLTRYPTATSTSRSIPSNGPSYTLDEGDVLAVIVDGVLGDFQDAPVHMPDKKSDTLPGMGYPIVVRANGTVDLPMIEPVNVRGLTTLQAQKKISNAYYRDKVIKPGKGNKVIATLLRKRTVSVTLIHDDPTERLFSGSPYDMYRTPRQKVSVVDLPADQTHMLDALGKAGAPFDAKQVLNVQRGRNSRASGRGQVGEGDVVRVPPQQRNFYYAGGELQGGRYPLDDGLNVLQAIAIADGNVSRFRSGRQGVFGPTQLLVVPGGGRSPQVIDLNQAVQNPNAYRVSPDDALILQYKRGEVLGNTALQVLRSGVLLRALRQ